MKSLMSRQRYMIRGVPTFFLFHHSDEGYWNATANLHLDADAVWADRRASARSTRLVLNADDRGGGLR